MELTREKLLRAYPQMPQSASLRLECTLDALQNGTLQTQTARPHRRLGFALVLALVLLAAAVGTAAYVRLGVFDFMRRERGDANVLSGAQKLVQTELAALDLPHTRIEITEAVYDGGTLRVVYSIAAKNVDTPLTEDDLADGDSAFYQALRADQVHPMCDWFSINGEEYTMTAGTTGEQIPGGENGEMLGYMNIQLASEGIVPEGDFTVGLPFIGEGNEWQSVEFTVRNDRAAQPPVSVHAAKSTAALLAASVSPVRVTATVSVVMDADATREEALYVFSDWRDAVLIDAEGNILGEPDEILTNSEIEGESLELSFTFLPVEAENIYLAPRTIDQNDNWFADTARALKLK